MNLSQFRAECGASFRSLVVFVFFGCIVLTGFGFVFGRVVPPGWVGVRQLNFGPRQGFQTKSLLPGYHWRIPFYSEVHLVPSSVQVIHFHRDNAEGHADFPPLEVQSADRATVYVDVSLIARFFSQAESSAGSAHGGPADLLRTRGLSSGGWLDEIRTVSTDALKRELGRLSTREFYNPRMREECVTDAQTLMNDLLAPSGIQIEGVLLRRYVYQQGIIEQAIFEKNLEDQKKALNEAASELAKARAVVAEEEALSDADVRTLKVQGESEALVVRSEGELYEKQRRAEADVLVAKARAESDRLKASAFAASGASRVYVGRELGPLLGSLKGGVVKDLNPYDLDQWMKRLGVDEGSTARAVVSSSGARQ